MNKNVLFLGPLYPIEREREIKENSIINSSNAPNVYQWNLLEGLHELLRERLQVINVLPVGTWKTGYRRLFFKDNEWNSRGIKGREIGSINFPFIKQWMRARKTRKYIENNINGETEIIIYSAYMPFLRAVYKFPENIKITAIITDLPEFYDLGKSSWVRKKLRKLQNSLIYKYLKRVDRFVVLTRQMCEPLQVGNRPWICIEGICNNKIENKVCFQNDKKIIFYSGTLHYQYGIRNLLDAFENMKQDNLELWICGSGEAEKEIRLLEKKDKRVKFWGFCTQENVDELRNQAAVLVNPRMNEGEYTKYSFPSKTIEYMLSGKPVLMYKLDGIPDEYDEYLNYVLGNSAEDLSKALENICEDIDKVYRDKALNAASFIRREKNTRKQAEKILKLMEER